MTISREVLDDELTRRDTSFGSIHLFDQLSSTSRWLDERVTTLDAHALPALCATDWQSEGSGRRGKTWVAKPGNVALSLLERVALPPEQLSGLSLVSGLAVAEVLATFCSQKIGVKWPNDLLCDGRKLGGILIGVQGQRAVSGALSNGGSTPSAPWTAVTTGIGINVVADERVSSLGIGGTTLADLGAEGVNRDRLLAKIAARVLAQHTRFYAQGWSVFADAWRQRDVLAGHEIDVLIGEGREHGRAIGVNADGALRVQIDGAERIVHGGEVSIRKRHESC